jgi:hypothetical protein
MTLLTTKMFNSKIIIIIIIRHGKLYARYKLMYIVLFLIPKGKLSVGNRGARRLKRREGSIEECQLL